MRRAVARGRILPQSLSTDPRYGRLALKAQVLYPLLWVNADDQGRLSGDPDEIKYAACPNVREIAAEEIPALLQQMETKAMIKVYTTSKTKAIQMLDWWDVQKLQWAYPSEYPPPEGWQDSLRYHPTPTEIITENWPPPSRLPSPPASALPSQPASALPSNLQSSLTTTGELAEEIRSLLMTLPETVDRLVEHEVIKDTLAKLGQRKGFIARPEVTTEVGRVALLWEEPTGELVAGFEIDIYEPKKKSLTKLKDLACPHSFVILRSNPEPFQWEQAILLIGLGAGGKKIKSQGGPLPSLENEKEKEKEGGRGRGILPSALGSPSPSLTGFSTDELKILHRLTACFKKQWGRVPAEAPDTIILREPDARESAQLRDLAKELSSAGGCPLDYIDQAFKEAAGQLKMHISYVRAVLFAWLGIERGRRDD